MHIVLDVILLTVMVYSLVHYFRKGFAASVVGLLRFVLATAFSLIFSGVLADVMSPAISRAIGQSAEESTKESARGEYIAYVIAFVLLFVISLCCLGLLESFFRKVLRKIPIIGFADGVCGSGVGLLVGLIIAALIVELYAALAVYVGGSVFSMKALSESVIGQFLYENNLFGLIFKALS